MIRLFRIRKINVRIASFGASPTKLHERSCASTTHMLSAPLCKSFGSPMTTNAALLMRCFSTDARKAQETIDALGEKVSEARELITDAHESFGTTYFGEDFQDAMEAVKECVDDWESLLNDVSDSDAASLKSRAGMRIAELKMAANALSDLAKKGD